MKKLLLLLVLGCTDPDAYYRGEANPDACTLPVPVRTACEVNPGCFTCVGYDGQPVREIPPGGCVVLGTVGQELCVNDCSECDPR